MNYDRIILELMDRVAALEEEVKRLKENQTAAEGKRTVRDDSAEEDFSANGGRDTTKYLFEGKLYGKNRLVLAVVKRYAAQHSNYSASRLMVDFDRTLQGSLGVVRALEDVQRNYQDYERRFFCQPHEIIHTTTEDCVVCTQWGKFNIGNFIARAEQMGMDIQSVGGNDGQMTAQFATGQLIGRGNFIKLYREPLEALSVNADFMTFIDDLRQKLRGMETKNTREANKEIQSAFYFARIKARFHEVEEIVQQVTNYGKQASAYISIYYAMYVLELES